MTEYLYHYTSAEGVEGIRKSGYIRASTDTTKDAVLGQGIYFTDLPPSTDKHQILCNNYGPGAAPHKQDCVQFYVRIPKDELRSVVRAESKDGSRVVYCYRENRVDLRDFTFLIGYTGTNKVIDTNEWSWVKKAAVAAAVTAAVVTGFVLVRWAFSGSTEKKAEEN